MNGLYDMYSAVQYENKALRQKVKAYENGERYLKLQKDYQRVVAGYIKEIKNLRRELADARATTVRVRDIWFEECDSRWEEYQAELNKRDEQIRKLEDRKWQILRESDEKLAAEKTAHEEEIKEKDAVIAALKAELAHAQALLGRNSTNTSTPTGQTPAGKKKHIPNSRRSTGKTKGGQPGHERHLLEKPAPGEVNEVIDHKVETGEECPACRSNDYTYTGECEEKYEYDIKVKVIKRLHKYWKYQCNNCGRIFRTELDPNLRAECQYGAIVQAIALSLTNTTNAAINKVPLFLKGLTKGEITPSQGYVAKLQGRAAKGLKQFKADLFKLMITREILYWDDTVVMANKARICLRYYGDETVAYYVAHDKKDMEGVLADGVLQALTEMKKVMHDHNSINYNHRFVFFNLECNAHLQRDLQKNADDTGHNELLEIKNLISQTIKERNDLVREGVPSFEQTYINKFNEKLTSLLDKAKKKADANESKYTGRDERALVNRIINYRKNFFAWVEDFSLPTTNNISERALRGVKSKMKVSGQFASSKTAGNYADIRTYIETCRRNGINEMTALIRLCDGNPYTVEEIFST